MVKNKRLILSVLFSLNALASPEDIYKSLGVSAGQVTAVSESEDDLCDNGPFKFVGDKGEEVLMVGPRITFHQPTKRKVNAVKADEETCAEDIQSTLSGKKLTMITSVNSCPKKLQHLTAMTEESIEVNKNTIKYTRKSKQGTSSCMLNWVANEKK